MVFISLIAGLAGSISWALTYLLMQLGSWRTPLLFYAAAFAFVAAPLLVFVLPSSCTRVSNAVGYCCWRGRGNFGTKRPAFMDAIRRFRRLCIHDLRDSAHFIPMIERGGIQASTAVGIACCSGPCSSPYVFSS